MVAQNHLLILGGRNVGKTTFGAQLLERLSQRESAIRLKAIPDNLTPFANARERLSGGVSPEHTSVTEHHEIIMPLLLPSGSELDLVWPDYGGEQITRMIEERRLSSQWYLRLQQSTAWLLFVRLSLLQDVEDIFSRNITVVTGDVSASQKFSSASATFFIELLQMMLYLKGTGVIKRVDVPKLAIIVSCWDEIDNSAEGGKPGEVLEKQVPLLSQFVSSVWTRSNCTVWGLSAQGRALDRERPDEEYLDKGPRKFGYILRPDGQKSSDITLPLLNLL